MSRFRILRLRPRRSERGAIAIFFALLVTVLFAVAAMGVDLGNAMNRHREIQTQADFAALAGGAKLPAPSLTPTANDDAVKTVAEYLIANHVYDDTGSTAVASFTSGETTPGTRASKINALAQHLVSTNPSDIATYGHVYYGWFAPGGLFTPDVNYVTVMAPTRQVNFGLASAVGFHAVRVGAQATAAIRSPGSVGSTLPFYAYSGCDWGQQIISHDTGGATTPNLEFPSDSTGNHGPNLDPWTSLAPNPAPFWIAANDTSTVLTINGSNLQPVSTNNSDPGVSKIGFFLPDGSTYYTVDAANFASDNGTAITLQVPSQVAATNGATFYIRVLEHYQKGGNWANRWSAVSSDMAFLEVGDTTLFCNDTKNSGNFGSLTIARTDSNNNANSGWLPLNIALGIDIPDVLLNVYTEPITTSSCDNGDSFGIFSDTVSTQINCLETDPGFPQNPATNGLITGVSSSPAVPGLLTHVDSGCGEANNLPPVRTVQAHGSYTINNEVLSCYFDNGSVTVGQVSSESYSGGVVISQDIYSSPRFFWIPIVNRQPANGRTSYPIVDFRAAFLTGENSTAYKGHSTASSYYYDDATTNGLVVAQNAVQSFRVVMINPNALPPVPGAGVPQPYAGSGPKILTLVD